MIVLSKLSCSSQLSWLQQTVLASANCPGFSKTSWLQQNVLASAKRSGFSKTSWLQQNVLASANCPGFSKLSWLQQNVLASAKRPGFMKKRQKKILATTEWVQHGNMYNTVVLKADLIKRNFHMDFIRQFQFMFCSYRATISWEDRETWIYFFKNPFQAEATPHLSQAISPWLVLQKLKTNFLFCHSETQIIQPDMVLTLNEIVKSIAKYRQRLESGTKEFLLEAPLFGWLVMPLGWRLREWAASGVDAECCGGGGGGACCMGCERARPIGTATVFPLDVMGQYEAS